MLLLSNFPLLGNLLATKWSGITVAQHLEHGMLEKHEVFLIPAWVEVRGNCYQVLGIWRKFLLGQRTTRRKKLIVYGDLESNSANYIHVSASEEQFTRKVRQAAKMVGKEAPVFPNDLPDPDLLPVIEAYVLTHKSNNFFFLFNKLQSELIQLNNTRGEIVIDQESKEADTLEACFDLVLRLRMLWDRCILIFHWLPDFPQLISIPETIRSLERAVKHQMPDPLLLHQQIETCLGGGLRQVRRVYNLESYSSS